MQQSLHVVLDDVTVVVPTIGRDLVEGCLRSIAGGSAWPARLIVIDQSSRPDIAAWVEDLARKGMNVEHLGSSQCGAAAARNRGFERVLTRFVAMTDDDCRVHPNWLERLAARLQEHPDALVSGRVDPVHASGRERHAPSIITAETAVLYRHPHLKRDPLFTNNMGAAMAVVERIGPMDEHPSVRYAEDAEWAYRALRAGVAILYAPDVRVNHLAWRDWAEMAETYRRYARSQGGFYGHYLRRGDPFVAGRAVFDVLRAPWLVLRGLATRNPELVAMGRAVGTQLLPGMMAGWRRSR
jgi:GT2 family glycosyltransferase